MPDPTLTRVPDLTGDTDSAPHDMAESRATVCGVACFPQPSRPNGLRR